MTRLAGILLLVAAGAAAQEKVTIKGKVVDADGAAVAGAMVATMWDHDNPLGGVVTDAQGCFELPADYYGRGSIGVVVMDKEKKRGALSTFSAQSFGKERELTLENLAKVSGKFSCSELGTPPPWTNVYVYAQPGNARVVQYDSEKAEFSFLLPPGDYKIHMYGADVKDRNEELLLEADKDFGTIDLAATNLAKLYGKPAPAIKVTAARGVKPEVQLKDYKGRYLLVEFWGFW
jgi:hypothetical protein